MIEEIKNRILSAFETLNKINVSDKTKDKNKLTYLPWAAAWEIAKEQFPDATFEVHKQVMDGYGNERFWFSDGKTGWVEVSVTINGQTLTEVLPIMDHRNQPIPADSITSMTANKAYKRCLAKCLALHGLGIYIYQGEDLPEELSKIIELQNEVTLLAKKKSALSDTAKERTISLCKDAEKEANPGTEDELITGKISNIEDIDVLNTLKKRLLTVRKDG